MTRDPPSGLATFIGQDSIKLNLIALIVAARKEAVALHHVILSGPTGMGKATLAKAIADEMGVNIATVPGDSLKVGDIAAILTNLRKGDLLFIDEVHRLDRAAEEALYPTMKDCALDVVIGKGTGARSIRLKLPAFTVVGATSVLPKVEPRLRNLAFLYEFSPYDIHQIGQIVLAQAEQHHIAIAPEAAALLAQYCEGVPGTASILLKRVHKHAVAFADGEITPSVVEEALASRGFGTGSPISNTATDTPQRGRSPIPDEVKMFVWRRDGGCCVKCGSRENLEFDHIIPLAMGGSNTARNLQLLCEKCNRSKGAGLA
ncbi:MAG: HNH endonuclease [Anaerolineae bacterium]|nr:HNH endonuclease [Anaerolineae bacterium]